MEENQSAEDKVQVIYDKVYELFDSMDLDAEDNEAFLVGVTQALVDKVTSSFEDGYHPYLVKDIGDLMHDFCNEYAMSLIDEDEDEDEDSEEGAE